MNTGALTNPTVKAAIEARRGAAGLAAGALVFLWQLR